MKFYIYLLSLVSLAISTSIHATTTCSAPKLSKVSSHNSIFHFKAEVTCKLVDVKINLAELKNAYRDEIMNPKSQFKVQSQSDYNNGKGMVGYKIDATQSYNTPHGPLSVRADIIIADDKTSKFDFEFVSKSVHARHTTSKY